VDISSAHEKAQTNPSQAPAPSGRRDRRLLRAASCQTNPHGCDRSRIDCLRGGEQSRGNSQMSRPTVERLRELLIYNPDTGVLVWKVDRGAGVARAGRVAGGFDRRGYGRLSIGGKYHLAHRVIWAFVHGEWPPDGFEVDHINRDKGDNRLANLRLATRTQNRHNTASLKHNRAGVRGVVRHKKKWRAAIVANGRIHHLGSYSCIGKAAKAYRNAVLSLHGDFAPQQDWPERWRT